MNTIELEKTIKDQVKQIDSLKKAIVGMQRQMMMMSKKIDRTYENARKNTNTINTLTGIVGRMGK